MSEARPVSPSPTAERLSVRGVVHRDAGAVRDLLGELGYPMSLDDVHSRLRALEGERDTKVLVAEDDGEIAGLAVVHWFELLEKPGRFARLLALVVARAYRGGGVGRLLVESSEAIARRAGCLGIEVTTAARRDEAREFYRQMGFETGESTYYRKRLDPAP